MPQNKLPKEEWEKRFEKYYARTIGIVADKETMSGKFAIELLENKKEFKQFIRQILSQERKRFKEMVEEKIKKMEGKQPLPDNWDLGYLCALKDLLSEWRRNKK